MRRTILVAAVVVAVALSGATAGRGANSILFPTSARTRSATTISGGRSTRRITSRSTTTRKSSSTWSVWPDMRRARTSTSAPELKYDLAFKIQLILFKTSAEFQQQNVIPGAAQEGVGAFAEPTRYRIVMPLDDPPDLLYRLIVHELTHQFEFDIIPTSLIRRNIPLWVNEGLSDYMTGIWRPIDLMTVRDAAVADIVPKMSELEGYTNVGSVRMIYNLGHAVFEFIESRWGKEGIRQFLFSLRKSVIGGGEDAYMEALRLTPEEFDQEFDKYPEGSLQAVPRQGAAGGLRPQSGSEPGRRSLHRRGLHRAVPVRRPHCDGHGQPARPRDGHRAGVVARWIGHTQSDQRVRSGQGMGVHHSAGHAVQHRPVAVVGPHRRSPRLLRATGKVAHADSAERDFRRRSSSDWKCARLTTLNRPIFRRMARRSPSPRCRVASVTSTSSIWRAVS